MATCPKAIEPGRKWTAADGASSNQYQCSAVAEVIGTVTWCPADTASENCSGDTGNSLCSNTINGLLALRVMGWQNPEANPGCCGRLSLQQALALIVSRQGTDVAG